MQAPSVYKKEALKKMEGRYGDVILYLIFVAIVAGVITAATDNFRPVIDKGVIVEPGIPLLVMVFSFINFLFNAGIAFGTASVFIDVTENNSFNVIDKIKYGFVNEYSRNIVLVFLRDFLIFLWALLLFIPGIIKAYAYSMSVYIGVKEPDVAGLDSISKSKEMMYGKKGDLFMLDLSYLGWYILSIFTLFILLLWVVPRHRTARTLFFNEIYYSQHQRENEEKDEFKEDDIFSEPLI